LEDIIEQKDVEISKLKDFLQSTEAQYDNDTKALKGEISRMQKEFQTLVHTCYRTRTWNALYEYLTFFITGRKVFPHSNRNRRAEQAADRTNSAPS